MTIFIDTPVPIDPKHPDAINPALAYLSYVAWPHPTSIEQANRDRLTTALAAAFYKQAGRQLPAAFSRTKRENIAGTAHKTLRRIQRYRLPAALLVLSRWAQQGHLNVSRAGLTCDQARRLEKELGIAALELRDPTDGSPDSRHFIPPETFHDIGPETWTDARPALAMTMALPLSWIDMAYRGRRYDEYGQLAALFMRSDWVPEAIWNARALALRLEHSFDPPTLLTPRRRPVRTDARLIPIHRAALQRLLNP